MLGLYLLVCLVAVGVLSTGALGASVAPLAEAAERFGGAEARSVVVVTALLSTAATANAVLVVTSRISFAMARDGLFFRALARASDRTGAPWAALITSAAVLGVVATTRSVAFAASAGGFLYVLHFVVPLVALVTLRRRGHLSPAAFRTPAPRVVLPLAFVACAALLVAGGADGAASGLGWLTLGVLGYALAAKRRARGANDPGASSAG